MLSTRSARLAAALLLALLLGWVVRAQRKGQAAPVPMPAPTKAAPSRTVDKSPTNSFPDE
ncbi:MAG: hypothetical protein ACO1TE_24780 [Prosthecobacter sp.]